MHSNPTVLVVQCTGYTEYWPVGSVEYYSTSTRVVVVVRAAAAAGTWRFRKFDFSDVSNNVYINSLREITCTRC